jgi:hypothetical protein
MATFKKKKKLDEKTKVFCVLGGYIEFRRALKRRGWYENKDPNSICFDLKWTLRSKDIEHGQLLEG